MKKAKKRHGRGPIGNRRGLEVELALVLAATKKFENGKGNEKKKKL